jgi:kelch-like protein 1/4/5
MKIEKYDLRANMWSHVANMNGRRLQFGVAVVDQCLYVVGGRDGLKTLNTVECYDFKSKTWTSLPSMSTHRHGLGNYSEHKYDCSFFDECLFVHASLMI